MSDIDLGEDDGFVMVKLGGAEVRIDLFDAHGQLNEHYQRFKDRPDAEYAQALVELMKGLGLPPCSHKLAHQFAKAVYERVTEAAKKNGGPADSPGSTASTPAA